MPINAGAVSVDLGYKLDDRNVKAYQKQLDRIEQRTKHKEAFKAELGGRYDERAFRAYQRDLDKAERANNDMVKANGRLRTSFGSIWSKGGAAFAAAGGAAALVVGVKSVVKANADAEASQKRVETAVKNAGVTYGAHAKHIDNVIQKQSKLAALDDEDLADSFGKLVGVTKDVNEALKLNGIAADVARGRQISLDAANKLVAKAYQGNAAALKRVGIDIKPVTDAQDRLRASTKHATADQVEAAKAADKQATAHRAVAAVQRRFAGQAEAYGKTQQGAMDRVSVAFENLQENLGKKLAPTITRAANGLARFIDQMSSGEGAGGRFARGIERVADGAKIALAGFNLFARGIRIGAGQIAGMLSRLLGGFSSVASFLSHIPGMGFMKGIARGIDDARGSLDRFKRSMDVGVAARDMEAKIGRLRSRTNASLGDIRKDTASNMREVRRRLGADSKEGADNLTSNFRAARTAIRRAMRDGTVSTRDGMAEIKRLTRAELRELGISNLRSGQQNTAAASENARAQIVANRKFAGGWIGAPGMVGPDVVPAMLAPGEAVLNRHQQAIVEGLLGQGFLDRLFATVQRPHYMQQGGRVPHFAVGGVTPAIESLISELDSKGFHHGSTTGPGHAPGGYHPRGMAVDYGDASNDMQRLWNVVFPQRRRFAELFGPTRVNPGPHLMHNGAGFQNAGLQADHQDHIHMALAAAIGALGNAAGAVWRAIKAPVVGGSGAMQAIVQGRLRQATSAINARGRAVAESLGGIGGGPGGGSNEANRALGRQMAAARGWTGGQFAALDRLWQGESGWSNTARNRSSGAFGIPQALPPGKMGPAGAGGNPRAQIAWGLNYIAERYGTPAAAYSAWLGRSPHWYAKGGRAKLPHGLGKATAGLVRRVKPLTTDQSAPFNALMARVESADNEYGRWERRFNVTDEELVDSDTGALNVKAIQRKARELGQLLMIRAGMERDLDRARTVARNLVRSYRRVITALRKSLRHATRKDRSGIRSYISTYEKRASEWQGKVGETGDSIFDAHTDVLSLRGELRSVLGTTPELRDPTADLGGDTGASADVGAGTDTTTADTTTAAPTAADIAAGVFAQLQTFNQGRIDLLSQFASNFTTPRQASSVGGVFNAPDQFTAAAGARYFGAGSVAGTLGGGHGGPVIVVQSGGQGVAANFASAPDSAPTLVQQLRFQVENGGAG